LSPLFFRTYWGVFCALAARWWSSTGRG
jgi:hypothetical protein